VWEGNPWGVELTRLLRAMIKLISERAGGGVVAVFLTSYKEKRFDRTDETPKPKTNVNTIALKRQTTEKVKNNVKNTDIFHTI